MKTKEQAAQHYLKNVVGTISEHAPKCVIADYTAGFEEAQRWISVGEEMPETKDDANKLSKSVVCKSEFFAEELSAYYDSDRDRWKMYPTGGIVL